MEPGTLVELSGGGARLESHLLMERGTRLQLRLEDDESGNPPVQVVAQVVHAEGSAPGRFGVKFETIHPTDQERLIRFIYRLQRRALRRKHMESD
jgi:c-di-GMP-binding flagellar brake protein YcgR